MTEPNPKCVQQSFRNRKLVTMKTSWGQVVPLVLVFSSDQLRKGNNTRRQEETAESKKVLIISPRFVQINFRQTFDGLGRHGHRLRCRPTNPVSRSEDHRLFPSLSLGTTNERPTTGHGSTQERRCSSQWIASPRAAPETTTLSQRPSQRTTGLLLQQAPHSLAPFGIISCAAVTTGDHYLQLPWILTHPSHAFSSSAFGPITFFPYKEAVSSDARPLFSPHPHTGIVIGWLQNWLPGGQQQQRSPEAETEIDGRNGHRLHQPKRPRSRYQSLDLHAQTETSLFSCSSHYILHTYPYLYTYLYACVYACAGDFI